MDKQTAEEYLQANLIDGAHKAAREYARLRSEEVAVKFGFYVAAEMFAAMKGVTRDKFLTEENRISVMKTIMDQFNSPEFQQYLNQTK